MPSSAAVSALRIGSNATMFMPKLCILRATSRPMRPIPRIARVLPDNSYPEYSFRSHRPSFSDCAACATLRANAEIRAHVSSQALMLLPPGVLKLLRRTMRLTCADERGWQHIQPGWAGIIKSTLDSSQSLVLNVFCLVSHRAFLLHNGDFFQTIVCWKESFG